jgi:hypothetical protein
MEVGAKRCVLWVGADGVEMVWRWWGSVVRRWWLDEGWYGGGWYDGGHGGWHSGGHGCVGIVGGDGGLDNGGHVDP